MRWNILYAIPAATVLVFAPARVAFAQQQGGDIAGSILDFIRIRPDEVVKMTTDWMNGTGVPGAIENISWALFLLLFAMQVVGSTATGSGPHLIQAFARMLIGGVLLSAAPTVNGWVRSAFMSFYDAGNQIWAGSVQPQMLASLGEYMGRLGTMFAALSGAAVLGSTGPLDFLGLDALTGTLLNLFMGTTRITLFLLAVVIGLYMVLQFAAGILIYLAQVFTPVAAAGLAHPRTEDWFGRWLRHVVHAILLVMLVNLLFGLAIHVGFVTPIERQNEVLANMANSLGNVSIDTLKEIFRAFAVTLLMPVTVTVGLIFGVITMWQAEVRVASFIGAVAAGIPMWLPFMRFMTPKGGGGGGGSPSPASPGGGGGSPSPASPGGGGSPPPASSGGGYGGSPHWLTGPERADMPPSGGARWSGISKPFSGGGTEGWFTAPERGEMLVHPRHRGSEGWLSQKERSEI